MGKEIIHLVGEFGPQTLARWEAWAELTDRVVQRSTFVDIRGLSCPLVILDHHGLNDAPLEE